MSAPKHSKKSCANNANPERHGNVRSLLGVRRPAGEGTGAFRRAGAARPPSYGFDSRLGARKTPANARTENHSGAIAFWMAAGRKWRAGHLCADVDALPHSELESGCQALLPAALAKLRRRAHFWALRPAAPGRTFGLPLPEPCLR